MEDGTVETLSAWIVPYNRREYVITRSRDDMAIGLAPLVVMKNSGDVLHGGSVMTLDEVVDAVESHGCAGLATVMRGNARPSLT